MPATRVLVLGATGMLGHEAVRVLDAAGFEIHGAARDLEKAREAALPANLHRLEALDPDSLASVLAGARPEVVINAVGLVKQLEDASRPLPAIALNALFPHRMAEEAAAVGARVVHISTDCVFCGELEPPAAYDEDAEPDARDLYGRTKLLGELHGERALTLRTSIIGPELGRSTGLFEWFRHQPGPVVRGFRRAIFSGLTTTALSRVLAAVLRDHPELAGLYHVASEPIDKHRLLSLLNDALDLGHEVQPVDEPRINRALDGSRFRAATGIEVPSWPAMVNEYAKERA